MKKTLYKKVLLSYVLLGLIGFFLVGTLGAFLVGKYLERFSLDLSRNRIVEIMLLMYLIIYVLLFFMIQIFRHLIQKPMHEIIHGASEFANGNLSYQIPIQSDDELGYLSNTLNYMADKLNQNGEYQRQYYFQCFS